MVSQPLWGVFWKWDFIGSCKRKERKFVFRRNNKNGFNIRQHERGQTLSHKVTIYLLKSQRNIDNKKRILLIRSESIPGNCSTESIVPQPSQHVVITDEDVLLVEHTVQPHWKQSRNKLVLYPTCVVVVLPKRRNGSYAIVVFSRE